MSASKLLPNERRAALSLAGIFALRMFGLFMIYPVFAVYARVLPDATPTRVGLALGIYGLAQALFQMPLGLLSDRVGRKRVIAGRAPGVRPGERVAGCPTVSGHRPGPLPPGHGCRGLRGAGAGGGPHPRRATHQGHGGHRHDHRACLRGRHGGGAGDKWPHRGAGHVLVDGGVGGRCAHAALYRSAAADGERGACGIRGGAGAPRPRAQRSQAAQARFRHPGPARHPYRDLPGCAAGAARPPASPSAGNGGCICRPWSSPYSPWCL